MQHKLFRPWYFDTQTSRRYTDYSSSPSQWAWTLTDYKNKHAETGCVLLQKTKCSSYPPKTAKEIELGTSDDAITWTCTDGKKDGSICTKSCADDHHFTNDSGYPGYERADNWRVRHIKRYFYPYFLSVLVLAMNAPGLTDRII